MIAEFERETGVKVVYIRADNRKGEFGYAFQDRVKLWGATFEPCPAYQHAYNGVSERIIYTIDYKIRSLLYQADMPVEY